MKKYKSYIFTILIVLLILHVILPQLDSLGESLEALKSANPALVLAAIIVYFSGVFILAVQFTALAFKKLLLGLTLRVEAATLFANKVVPNGVGTISLNAYYLVKKDHTPAQSASVITMNSATSFIAYIVLIIVALLAGRPDFSGLRPSGIPLNAVIFVLLLIFGAGFALYHAEGLRAKIRNGWKDVRTNLLDYKQRPRSVVIALIFNGMGTAVNIMTMVLVAHAVGIELSFANALIAYTFGNIATALVPTPGGIGSAEAGIYSGLVLAGLSGTDAMTVTLLYRFVSYWLPILPGYYFFWGLKKDLLADFSIRKHKAEPAMKGA